MVPDAPGTAEFVDRDGSTCLVLTGAVDLQVIEQITDDDVDAHRHPGHPMTVDLSNVTFIDCSGLGLLVRLRADEGLHTLGTVPSPIRRLLALTGLTTTLGLRQHP